MEPQLEGQRKPVTALFADVVDSTRHAERTDPEDWSSLVAALVGAITEAVERYGGTVTQFLGDGVLAIFGAPVAHEDDPERAVRAGLDAIAAVDRLRAAGGLASELGVAVRVGINSGLAIVGEMPTGRGSAYTALGDAVNVASRVETAAEAGQVWVTGSTRRLLGPAITLADRGSIEAKGKTELVPVYQVVSAAEPRAGRPGVPGLYSPLVGRATELERLREAVATVRAGRGRAAILVGEPGIGKSRLLAELRSGAGERLRWVVANGLSYGDAMPFHLARQIVAGLAGLPPDAEPEAVAARLRDRPPVQLPDGWSASTVLEHLLGRPPAGPEGERLAGLEVLALHAAYAAAVRALLEAVVADGGGQAPIALVVEDLHWADPSSADLLVRLLPVVDERPVLVLATTRPDRDAAGWRAVTAARDGLGPALVEVSLSPLSAAESRVLVGHLLRIESLPPALREAILERAEGNPFFVEEVVRMLVDRGLIVRSGEHWEATAEIESIEIPETIHGLLLARIDRLADEPRRVVRAAAVLGREFPLPLLEAVTGPAGAALGRLEAAGLVTLAAGDPASRPGQPDEPPAIRYAFRHALVQEAAYDSLLKRERRQLHLAVAEALERLHPDRRRELAGVLAGHYEAAGAVDRAVDYLLIAGEEALRTFSEREAYAFFGRVIDLLPAVPASEPDRRRRLAAGLGRHRAGRTFVPYEQALGELNRVLPLAEELDDADAVARVHLGIADLRLEGPGETLETSEALAHSLDTARRIARERGLRAVEAQAIFYVATSESRTGRYRESIDHYREAAELFESIGVLNGAGVAWGLVAVGHARRGEFAAASERLERARRLAEESGDPNARLDLAIYGGMIEAERGRPDLTIQLAREGVEQADELGNFACSLVGNFFIGRALTSVGELEQAATALQRSESLATFCQVGPVANLSRAWLSALRARGGERQAGLAGLEQALGEARRLRDRQGEADILRERAEVLAVLRPDDPEAPLADLRAAIAVLEEIEARPALAATLRQAAALLASAGDQAGAEAAEARARAVEAAMAAGVEGGDEPGTARPLEPAHSAGERGD